MKFLLFILLYISTLSGVELTKKALRASFETVEISPEEDLGLLGTSYLIEPNENFYYGLGVYSAVTGKRGGFFVGGATAGYKYELYKNLYLDSGVFFGGGGGGSAPQGGGMMLKGYLGGLYSFDAYSLGLNYSYVNFPNGDISSSQISVVADVKFEDIYGDIDVDIDVFKEFYYLDKEEYLVATYQTYFPQKDTLKVGGAPLEADIKLIGVEYGYDLSDDFIAYIESAGAFGGDSTGYMEILGGVGYSKELLKDLSTEAKFSLGAAGGGRVDTGGGGVSKAYAGFKYAPTDDIFLGVSGGYYHALEGGFDATIAKVQLGLNTHFLTLSSSTEGALYENISMQKFQMRFSHQTYLYNEALSAKRNGLDVHLVGAKLDWFLSENLYLSGQASAAYKGEAGGYAAGMFALGYQQPLFWDISLVGELAAGAAGGGSLQTGEGSIVVPSAGLLYSINKKLAIELLYGKVIATNGDVNSDMIDFSLVYRFDKLVHK